MPASLVFRLGGLLSIAIGLGVFWVFLWQPLMDARAGVAEVRYELRAFALVPLCIVFGAAFLLYGPNLDYRKPDGSNLTATGWSLFGLITIFTALGFWWFNQQFAGLGYY